MSMKNFYPLFGLETYAEFNLSEDEVFDKLVSYFEKHNVKNWTSILSDFETGKIILSSPFFKRIYDAELKGFNVNPLHTIYIYYIVYVYKIRSFIFYLKQMCKN